jgi:hypothetical protein
MAMLIIGSDLSSINLTPPPQVHSFFGKCLVQILSSDQLNPSSRQVVKIGLPPNGVYPIQPVRSQSSLRFLARIVVCVAATAITPLGALWNGYCALRSENNLAEHYWKGCRDDLKIFIVSSLDCSLVAMILLLSYRDRAMSLMCVGISYTIHMVCMELLFHTPPMNFTPHMHFVFLKNLLGDVSVQLGVRQYLGLVGTTGVLMPHSDPLVRSASELVPDMVSSGKMTVEKAFQWVQTMMPLIHDVEKLVDKKKIVEFVHKMAEEYDITLEEAIQGIQPVLVGSTPEQRIKTLEILKHIQACDLSRVCGAVQKRDDWSFFVQEIQAIAQEAGNMVERTAVLLEDLLNTAQARAGIAGLLDRQIEGRSAVQEVIKGANRYRKQLDILEDINNLNNCVNTKTGEVLATILRIIKGSKDLDLIKQWAEWSETSWEMVVKVVESNSSTKVKIQFLSRAVCLIKKGDQYIVEGAAQIAQLIRVVGGISVDLMASHLVSMMTTLEKFSNKEDCQKVIDITLRSFNKDCPADREGLSSVFTTDFNPDFNGADFLMALHFFVARNGVSKEDEPAVSTLIKTLFSQGKNDFQFKIVKAHYLYSQKGYSLKDIDTSSSTPELFFKNHYSLFVEYLALHGWKLTDVPDIVLWWGAACDTAIKNNWAKLLPDKDSPEERVSSLAHQVSRCFQTSNLKNPYHLYWRLARDFGNPLTGQLKLQPQEIDTEQVIFNLEGFQSSALKQKDANILTGQLKEVEPNFLENSFAQLKSRLISDDLHKKFAEKVEEGLTFETLEEEFVKDSYLKQLLKVQRVDRQKEVSLEAARFIAIVHYIQIQSDVSELGEFSQREEVLIKMASSIQECSKGKKMNIGWAYRLLPKEWQYEQEIVESGSAESYLDAVVQEVLEEYMSNKALMYTLTGQDDITQLPHQVIYLKNIMGPTIGLRHSLEFDHSTEILDDSLLCWKREEIVRLFYTFFTPAVLVKALQRSVKRDWAACVQGVPSLYMRLSDFIGDNACTPTKGYWSANEEETEFFLTDKGALALLKRAGYLQRHTA